MKFTPLRITLIYLTVALIWIATTDSLLEYYISDMNLFTTLQTVKGWFYVIATAVGLYTLIKIYEQQIQDDQRKLERVDESLTMALESANTATWEYFVDSDSYITSSNHNRFFDYPADEELSLNHINKRLNPDDAKEFSERVMRTLEYGEELNVEYRVIDSKNRDKWLWTKGKAIKKNGNVERVIGITTDITESKQLKQNLDLEKEKVESLFDQIPVLITVFNPEANVLEINKEFENVLGWTTGDIQEKDILELCYPDEQMREQAVFFMKSPNSGWKELKVTAKTGEVRTQLWSNIKLSDSTIVGIGHDITERKNLEKEVQQEKDRLLDIFNNLPVMITIYSSEGDIIEINHYAADLLGITKNDLHTGDFLKKLISDEDEYIRAKNHMKKADSTWKRFYLHAKNGQRLKTNWMNMQLSENLKLGVGIDFTKLKGLEERLEMAVKGGRIGLWDYYPKTNAININNEWAEMLGYSLEELEPVTFEKWETLTHPNDVKKAKELLQKHFAGEISSYDTEVRMKHKEGHWVWLIDRGEVSEWDKQGNSVRITGTHLDITGRKILEEEIKESRERLQLTTRSANVGLWEWNPQSGEVILDEIWARLVGYSLGELEPVSIETWNKLVHPADLERFKNTVQTYFNSESDLYECEVRMRHKKGHWIWILDRGRTVEWNDEGAPTRMLGTHVDITYRKEKEQELKESERLLKETQRVANLGTYTLDLRSMSVQTSAILDQMFWKNKGEKMTVNKLHEIIHPEYRYISELYKKAMSEGNSFEGEYKILNQETEEERWIYEKADHEMDENDEPIRMIGVMLDITRSKKQELRIRRTLEQLRISEQIAQIGYWEKNLDSGELFWGENKYDLFEAEKSNGPLSRNELFKRIHKDDRQVTLEAYKNAEKYGALDHRFRYRKADSSYRTIREKADVVTDSTTGERILRGVSMDISSLKEMESELQDERKRLNIITSLVSDVVWDWNIKEGTILWSEGMRTVFGYNKLNDKKARQLWEKRVHPEDKHRVKQSINDALSGGDISWSQEYRFLDSADDVRYVYDQAYIYRNKKGEALQMVGAMIDRTEEKKAEMVLSYQANLLRDISDAVIATDSDMKITSWNWAAEELYGWHEHEVLGEPIGEVVVTEFEHQSNERTMEVFRSEGEWSGEVIQYNKKGEPIYILSSVRMLTNNEDEFSGAVAVNKDITVLKEIQNKLDYEQSRFEYVTAVVSDAIWDANPNEGTVWWSEGLEVHFKHSVPSQDDGEEFWVSNVHPDDRERVLSSMEEAEQSGATEWACEYRFLRGDGTVANVIDKAYLLRNDNEELLRIIGAMNDITLQKEAEIELKRSEQQYRLLYKQSPLPMWIYDTDTFRILSVNDAAVDTYGYSSKEFKTLTIFDLFMPEDQESIREEAERNLKQPRTGFDVWNQKLKSGEVRICELSGSNIYFRGEQQRLVVSVDVTEQRKAEEMAIKSVVEGEERERHRIANELHDGLGQYLSAANMHLSTVFSDNESLNKKEDKAFKTGLQMLQHAISETRSISQNLLPKSIQDYGLKVAVESLLNEMKSSIDQDFHLFQKYDDDQISSSVQINIYRIVQESINNAVKHSGAKTIDIQIIESDGKLICAIEDDGIGFNVDSNAGSGLGIQSMRTRVSAMSGNLNIDSKKNIGTLITAIIPIQT